MTVAQGRTGEYPCPVSDVRPRGRIWSAPRGSRIPTGHPRSTRPAPRPPASSPTTPRGCPRSSSTTPSTSPPPRRRSRAGSPRPRTTSGSSSRRSAAARGARSAPRIPTETAAWLTTPYRHFGARLGCVLLRVDESTHFDEGALARLLAAWPGDIPVAFEFQHASWDMDETHALLRAHGAGLVATDLDDADEPVLRRVGPFLYLRLRRTVITDADVAPLGGAAPAVPRRRPRRVRLPAPRRGRHERGPRGALRMDFVQRTSQVPPEGTS